MRVHKEFHRFKNHKHIPQPFFFSWRRKLTEGRLQVSDLLSISYITLNKLLFCFMHHPSSFLYWPVEEITWVKWALFLEQILYLFQTFYYPLANHLIMRILLRSEKGCQTAKTSFVFQYHYYTCSIFFILNYHLFKFLSFICQYWCNSSMKNFKNCIPVCLEHMSNYYCKALGDPFPKRNLYWIKTSLELWIFCFASVVFLCLFFFLS